MTNNVQTYEFTAITEGELTGGGNVKCGTHITMPDDADVCFTVKDNDPSLSGDCRDQARDHSFQTAQIVNAETGEEIGNGGQVYAECYYWVRDGAGNWYVLLEVEQEGSNDDYFTFYTGGGFEAPAPGTELYVHSKCNVGGNWVDYKCLDGGEKPPADGTIAGRVFCDEDCDGLSTDVTVIPGCDYTIEAEAMHAYGFHDFHSTTASGGAGAKLGYDSCRHETGAGDLWTTFGGKDGVYDLKLFVQDENDGCSIIKVKVNGQVVKTIYLDENNNGAGSDNGAFNELLVEGLDLKAGDTISLWADGKGGEFVRIDKIELEGRDQEVVDQEPGKEGVLVTLLNADGTEVLDENGNPITTVTDADGAYRFEGVPEGDYRVKFANPDGTEFTTQNVGSDDSIDSDVDANGVSDVISVSRGQTSTADAGLKDIEPGSLSGRYFCDENRNGVDDGEAGVAGVTVILLGADGQPTGATTTTADDGSYSFAGLNPGIYGVRFEDAVSGKVLIEANVGDDDAIDSDATDLGGGVSEITGIEVVSGQNTPDNDAGVEEAAGALSGRYFCDENRDGTELDDAGQPEAGVEGVLVALLDANGQSGARRRWRPDHHDHWRGRQLPLRRPGPWHLLGEVHRHGLRQGADRGECGRR